MELELFNFVDETMRLYDENLPCYVETEKILKVIYQNITKDFSESITDVFSRIKARDSVQEKLLRNKYYLDFANGEDALGFMPDIIGITIECQFIRNEAQLYQKLFYYFKSSDSLFSRCHFDEDNYLNLHMMQPQLQRNGFTIYRIDGYYMYKGKKINYELQIKSLVHRFWSEIEHSVVYKNPDFVAYDHFMKSMLETVRDNLDVVDRQLEIIYKEISNTSRHQQIGMDPDNFKVMLTASITELVNRKMKDTIGFTSDFKASASILAQFIYINDFANAENAKVKMVDYLEHLNLLFASDLDFKAPIFLEDEFVPKDKFSEILGNYWISRMNIDFEWHVFFVMLFAIEPDSATNDFVNFISIIKQLLILPTWYQNKFSKYKEKEQIKEEIDALLANSLISVKKVKMIHEDYLYQMMDIFHSFVEKIETDYTSGEDILNDLDNIKKRFMYSVQRIVTK